MNMIRIYLLIVMIGLIFINCTEKTNSKLVTDHSETEELNSQTELIKVSKEQYFDDGLELTKLIDLSEGSIISATGIIDVPPNGRSVISAKIGGYIHNSPLLIGDRVKKGQLLVTIENIEFVELQQQYLESKEQLTFLESDYYRQKELFDEKITSEKSFLKAQSEYKKNLAVYTSLRKKLELLNISIAEVESGNLSSVSKIYAPISGNITNLNITTGLYVSSADIIMEIVSTEHLHLELRIFEKDMLKIKIGQPVKFTLPESGNTSYQGKVHLIGKSIESDRTVTVHAHIDEAHEIGFVPGMFVQAEIMTNEFSGIAIVKDAVIEKKDKFFIMLLQSEEGGQYNFQEIEVETRGSFKDLMIIESDEQLDLNEQYLKGYSNY